MRLVAQLPAPLTGPSSPRPSGGADRHVVRDREEVVGLRRPASRGGQRRARVFRPWACGRRCRPMIGPLVRARRLRRGVGRGPTGACPRRSGRGKVVTAGPERPFPRGCRRGFEVVRSPVAGDAEQWPRPRPGRPHGACPRRTVSRRRSAGRWLPRGPGGGRSVAPGSRPWSRTGIHQAKAFRRNRSRAQQTALLDQSCLEATACAVLRAFDMQVPTAFRQGEPVDGTGSPSRATSGRPGAPAERGSRRRRGGDAVPASGSSPDTPAAFTVIRTPPVESVVQPPFGRRARGRSSASGGAAGGRPPRGRRA